MVKNWFLWIESHPILTSLAASIVCTIVILIYKYFLHPKIQKFKQKRLFDIRQKIIKADIQNGITFWQVEWNMKNNTSQDIILTREHYRQNANIKFEPNGSVRIDRDDIFYIYKFRQYVIPAHKKLSWQFEVRCRIESKHFNPPTLLMWKGDRQKLIPVILPLKRIRKRWGSVVE